MNLFKSNYIYVYIIFTILLCLILIFLISYKLLKKKYNKKMTKLKYENESYRNDYNKIKCELAKSIVDFNRKNSENEKLKECIKQEENKFQKSHLKEPISLDKIFVNYKSAEGNQLNGYADIDIRYNEVRTFNSQTLQQTITFTPGITIRTLYFNKYLINKIHFFQEHAKENVTVVNKLILNEYTEVLSQDNTKKIVKIDSSNLKTPLSEYIKINTKI